MEERRGAGEHVPSGGGGAISVTEITTAWSSEIVVSAAPLLASQLSGWDVAAWGLDELGGALRVARLAASLASGEGHGHTQCTATPCAF